MKPQAIVYIAALHQIQHTLFELEAGNITPEQAQRDVADTAFHVPRLDREWRQSLREK